MQLRSPHNLSFLVEFVVVSNRGSRGSVAIRLQSGTLERCDIAHTIALSY